MGRKPGVAPTPDGGGDVDTCPGGCLVRLSPLTFLRVGDILFCLPSRTSGETGLPAFWKMAIIGLACSFIPHSAVYPFRW